MTMRIDPEELRDLTRRYARFSRSAAGLGNALGGVFVLVAYFVGALVPLEVWTRILLAALPIVWLVVREFVRRHLYQRHGRVAAVTPVSDRRWHLFFTGFMALVSLVVLVSITYWLASGLTVPGRAWPGLAAYMAFMAALPFLVWRYLLTALDFITGSFLIIQAAVVIGGSNYELGDYYVLTAPIAAVALIALGLWEHREFRHLERRLRGSGSDRGRR
jgi:hypothetical protein